MSDYTSPYRSNQSGWNETYSDKLSTDYTWRSIEKFNDSLDASFVPVDHSANQTKSLGGEKTSNSDI